MKRCAQCWQFRPNGYFLGARGAPIRTCVDCREKYSGWSSKTLTEKLYGKTRVDSPPAGYVLWMSRSGNKKLGGLPASISERGTCPSSCGFYLAGCYAEYGKLGSHWRRVGETAGLLWSDFLARVRCLPEGQLWRHNEAGDLAGDGEDLDERALSELVEANMGRRGFTFTHKHKFESIRWAVSHGFTINLSADTLDQADELAALGVAPVAVILPHDATRRTKTPAGRRVVVCPAQTTERMTCADCQLCAKPWRKSIVGFRAHGQFKAHVPELIRLRVKS